MFLTRNLVPSYEVIYFSPLCVLGLSSTPLAKDIKFRRMLSIYSNFIPFSSGYIVHTTFTKKRQTFCENFLASWGKDLWKLIWFELWHREMWVPGWELPGGGTATMGLAPRCSMGWRGMGGSAGGGRDTAAQTRWGWRRGIDAASSLQLQVMRSVLTRGFLSASHTHLDVLKHFTG